MPTQYVDCDVEEPNGHLSIKPLIQFSEEVSVPVPSVWSDLCNDCGVCGDVCQYGAIAPLGGKAMVFEELCHGCGGCALLCPAGAISEINRRIGTVESGLADKLQFIQGRIDVGVAMSPPVIRDARALSDRLIAANQFSFGFISGRAADTRFLQIIDSPPGTSCSMVTAVRGCDFVVMVTEPTPFGLHDMILAIETVREMGIRTGVVINKCDMGDSRTTAYCRENDIPVLLEIPQSRHIAAVCSGGETLLKAVPAIRPKLIEMHEIIRTGGSRNGRK
jgi:MinD superfamily P-loop ATPase